MLRSHDSRQATLRDEDLLRMLASAPATGHLLVKRLAADGREVDPYLARTTYLGLHRLERQGLLRSEWRPVPGRSLRAKYYRITTSGRRGRCSLNFDSAPVLFIHPLTILLAVAIIGPGDTASGPRQSRRPSLTILVDSHVPIALDEVRQMSMDVTRIFGAIGVKADCDFQGPAGSRGASSVSVQRPLVGFVVHAVIIAGLPGPPSSDELFLGVTPPGNDSAAEILLFHEQIEELAHLQQKAAASVLALVVAHEIGHVLLPAPAHSGAGIMQAPWDRHALDQADDHALLFTARQGELIRQRLNRCCELIATR